MSDWSQVIKRITEIGHWPADYFLPIPGFSEEPAAQATDASIPATHIDHDHYPRVEDENGVPQSDHEMDDDSQGSVLGSVERGEQGNKVGGVGADEHV
ncbi:hypothetical protein Moror_1877 [Moniliophthora roreri MCA 2997]|uniref:Uncharacterized protein n=1 Tax=Moniliophthora roreri (strain MCA 2997) TaxID=1381753 RepID=V2WLG8_MONRO|nr:hypothetical protein Moror_1877 [Moniliophthora roreri MCA 2997]